MKVVHVARKYGIQPSREHFDLDPYFMLEELSQNFSLEEENPQNFVEKSALRESNQGTNEVCSSSQRTTCSKECSTEEMQPNHEMPGSYPE